MQINTPSLRNGKAIYDCSIEELDRALEEDSLNDRDAKIAYNFMQHLKSLKGEAVSMMGGAVNLGAASYPGKSEFHTHTYSTGSSEIYYNNSGNKLAAFKCTHCNGHMYIPYTGNNYE